MKRGLDPEKEVYVCVCEHTHLNICLKIAAGSHQVLQHMCTCFLTHQSFWYRLGARATRESEKQFQETYSNTLFTWEVLGTPPSLPSQNTNIFLSAVQKRKLRQDTFNFLLTNGYNRGSSQESGS